VNTLIIILIILVGINTVLSLCIFLWTRKYKAIDSKDKEFIIFVIDMYIQYAEELNIHSEKQHKELIKHLEKIKKKYFYEENKKSILNKTQKK